MTAASAEEHRLLDAVRRGIEVTVVAPPEQPVERYHQLLCPELRSTIEATTTPTAASLHRDPAAALGVCDRVGQQVGDDCGLLA